MSPIELHHYWCPFVSLNTCCLKSFCLTHLGGNTACIIYDMFTHELESARGL